MSLLIIDSSLIVISSLAAALIPVFVSHLLSQSVFSLAIQIKSPVAYRETRSAAFDDVLRRWVFSFDDRLGCLTGNGSN